jgi:hypothetical protein
MQPGQAPRIGPHVETVEEALAGAGAEMFAQLWIPDHANERRDKRGYVPGGQALAWCRESIGGFFHVIPCAVVVAIGG